MKPGLDGSGRDEGIRFGVLNRRFRLDLNWLVSCLAKLSVKEGGEEAARRLHRYLTAGANANVPAYEITVFHGLVMVRRFDLGAGAYLAPYEYAKSQFDLPNEPEPRPKENHPNAAVLVRSLRYGPGVVTSDDEDVGLPNTQVSYRFPTDYRIDLESWFDDAKLLVDLLSIAARVPLLSRTRFVRVAKWIEEIDPNLAFGTQVSGGFVSDVWPKGHDLSKGAAATFASPSRGYHKIQAKRDAINLAIRRLAAAFSRPGGRFDVEDRILDVAIALEVLYGGKTGTTLAPRAAALLGSTVAQQQCTYDQAKRFYRTRSRIAHRKKPTPATKMLPIELEAGRDLAGHTLASLLSRDTPMRWADVMRRLRPETQAYIAADQAQQNP